MHQVADVEVAKNIMDANKKLADRNKKNLEEKGIFCVDFVGAIGSGKTTLVEEIIDNTRCNLQIRCRKNRKAQRPSCRIKHWKRMPLGRSLGRPRY